MKIPIIEQVRICDVARIPVIWLVTHEEDRAEKSIAVMADENKRRTFIWSMTGNSGIAGWTAADDGVIPLDNKGKGAKASLAMCDAVKYALDQNALARQKYDQGSIDIAQLYEYGVVFIFKDLYPLLRTEPALTRAMRDAASKLRHSNATIVCISPHDDLPIDLSIDVEVVRPGLPSKEEVKAHVETSLEKSPDLQGDYSPEEIEGIINACCGLTLNQAADALYKSVVLYNKIVTSFIHKIKTEDVSNTPGLTYIEEVPTIDQVGGFGELKKWMTERKGCFSKEAKDFGLPSPKGLLCLGIPGAGKSLFAKAVSSYLDIPLIKFNPPDLKGGIVGRTEENFRRAKTKLEALGPCCIWIDELEKTVAKAGTVNSDGGTSDTVLNSMLDFFQERKGQSFVIATGNDVSALPPELLRKGRFDAIFFVDLPNQTEREEIVRIHLQKRKRNFSDEDVISIATAAENLSGAEIESAIESGMWRAFSAKRDLIPDDVILKLREDPPLSELMAEKISALREWASERARPASSGMIKESSPEKSIQKREAPRRIRSINKEDLE